jgi:uncharacterized membrane protein YphA (DoxX/SURF4 family)
MRRLGAFIGRALMSGIFIGAGLSTVRDPGERRTQQVADIGLPNPEALVRLNGAAMLAGGVAMAAGILPRAAATGLALSLIPTTYAGHRFWREDDPATKAQQRTHFLKNLAIVGGLIGYVALTGRAATTD